MPNPALNAKKHGLLSECPVLDGVETQEAWLAHRQRFWDDLQPAGAVEEALVERIALTLWRMARLARAEAAAANRHREQEIERVGRVWLPEIQGFLTLAEARAEVRLRDEVCDWLAAYPLHADDADPLPPALVAALRHHLEDLVDDYLATLDGRAPSAFASPAPRVMDVLEPTVGELRALFQQVAAALHQPLETLLPRVTALAHAAAAAFSRSVRDAERQVEQVRATCQLPPEPELQLLTRYDAHLGRELARLFRTLRDLRTFPSSSPVPTPPELGAGGLTPSNSNSNPNSNSNSNPNSSSPSSPRVPKVAESLVGVEPGTTPRPNRGTYRSRPARR